MAQTEMAKWCSAEYQSGHAAAGTSDCVNCGSPYHGACHIDEENKRHVTARQPTPREREEKLTAQIDAMVHVLWNNRPVSSGTLDDQWATFVETLERQGYPADVIKLASKLRQSLFTATTLREAFHRDHAPEMPDPMELLQDHLEHKKEA